MPKTKKHLTIDYNNSDPFRGLPHRFPMRHSRFPAEPSAESASIQASEPTYDKRKIAAAIKQVEPSEESQRDWAETLRRVAIAQKPTRKR